MRESLPIQPHLSAKRLTLRASQYNRSSGWHP